MLGLRALLATVNGNIHEVDPAEADSRLGPATLADGSATDH